jgi:hypothetical protein
MALHGDRPQIKSWTTEASVEALAEFFASRGYAVEALPNGLRVGHTTETLVGAPGGAIASVYVVPGPTGGWLVQLVAGAAAQPTGDGPRARPDTTQVRGLTAPGLGLIRQLRESGQPADVYRASAPAGSRPAAQPR